MSVEIPNLEDLLRPFDENMKAFSGFMYNVIDFFNRDNTSLYYEDRFVIHSTKYRMKDKEHLAEKICRKISMGRDITAKNVLSCITDFCGVRVLHLRLDDFTTIHKAILKHVDSGHWVLGEEPKAYTWDPEYQEFFEKKGIKTEIKNSFYTSVHYLVKPNNITDICCEIQVRTLFEEIWGEIDHEINYPEETDNVSRKEQIKVLAKLVGAGNKLIDSIHKS